MTEYSKSIREPKAGKIRIPSQKTNDDRSPSDVKESDDQILCHRIEIQDKDKDPILSYKNNGIHRVLVTTKNSRDNQRESQEPFA